MKEFFILFDNGPNVPMTRLFESAESESVLWERHPNAYRIALVPPCG